MFSFTASPVTGFSGLGPAIGSPSAIVVVCISVVNHNEVMGCLARVFEENGEEGISIK